MITRFRVEGMDANKDELIDELSLVATRIITVVDPQHNGNWECTQDVTHWNNKIQKHEGRMVLVYRGVGEINDN